MFHFFSFLRFNFKDHERGFFNLSYNFNNRGDQYYLDIAENFTNLDIKIVTAVFVYVRQISWWTFSALLSKTHLLLNFNDIT